MERLTRVGQVHPFAAKEIAFSRLGVGFEKLDRAVFDPEKAYDKIGALGCKWVRVQSGWQRTEKQKGVYDFGWLDSIVDNLRARGMNVWVCLCYGNALYTDSAKDVFGAVGCPPIHTQEEKDAWSAYVSALVKRYQGRVQWYEVWNEPDGQWCWKHGVSATEYGVFCADTARAVKQADPLAKVMGGSLCGAKLSYIKEALDAGMAGEIDALTFHRYSRSEKRVFEEYDAMKALLAPYHIALVQGESGGQSSSRGAGAMRGGAWTQERQAKHLLRHRLCDLHTDMLFTSHFTSVDMIEALNGSVSDRHSYLDYGYFGLLSATFDENGFSTGDYEPKMAYRAMRTLCSVFSGDVSPCALPIIRQTCPSPRLLGSDYDENDVLGLGFRRGDACAYAYWVASELLTQTIETTITLETAGVGGEIRLIDLMDGSVYALPEGMAVRDKGGMTLRNLPALDRPLLLTFGDFAPRIDRL